LSGLSFLLTYTLLMTWEKARQKITEGVEYRDTVPVQFGDETIDLTYRLLNEGELFEVESAIDTEALLEHRESEDSAVESRIRELQQKDTLSDREKRELEDLSQRLAAEQQGIMDSMGYETYQAFMNAGKTALVPSEEDINNAFELGIDEQERRFGTVPNGRDEMFDALKTEMETMVDNQPYPIKFMIGQTAYAESLTVLGDVDNEDVEQGNVADQ